MGVENPNDFPQEANQAPQESCELQALGRIQERPIDVFLVVSPYGLYMAFHSLFSSESVKCWPQISAGHYLALRGARSLLVRSTGRRFEFRSSCSSGGMQEGCAVHSCLSATRPKRCTARGMHLVKPHVGEENRSHVGCMRGAVLAPHEPLLSAHFS